MDPISVLITCAPCLSAARTIIRLEMFSQDNMPQMRNLMAFVPLVINTKTLLYIKQRAWHMCIT